MTLFLMAVACFVIGIIVILTGSVSGLLFGQQANSEGNRMKDTASKAISFGFGAMIILVGLALLLFSSAIYVKDNEGGLVIKRFGKDLAPGRIIAVGGEKGPQARVLPPGWHFFYWPWQY